MYASLPVALSDVTPRNPEIRDKAVGAMVADVQSCWARSDGWKSRAYVFGSQKVYGI
jgi:hypothetical protein